MVGTGSTSAKLMQYDIIPWFGLYQGWQPFCWQVSHLHKSCLSVRRIPTVIAAVPLSSLNEIF
jgi:hypothetical protein